jgi:hypothetical protein
MEKKKKKRRRRRRKKEGILSYSTKQVADFGRK